MKRKILVISIPVAVFTQYLTRKETAQLLNVDLQTVRNWTKKGKIKAHKYGHRVFYNRLDLIQSLTSN